MSETEKKDDRQKLNDDRQKWAARRDDTVAPRFADLYLSDDLANDAARQAALAAGEPKPQGLGEFLAAKWHEYTLLQPWSATRRGQQRFNEALAEQARMGALAYVYGDSPGVVGAGHNAYTRFLVDRYGPYARDTQYPAGLGWSPDHGGLPLSLLALLLWSVGLTLSSTGYPRIIAVTVSAAILLYLGADLHPEMRKRIRAFGEKIDPALGSGFWVAALLGMLAVSLWALGGLGLGMVVVLVGLGLLVLFTIIHERLMEAAKGRGLGGNRCLVTPATAPGDARRLQREDRPHLRLRNPFGPKRFRYFAGLILIDTPPASIASWLGGQLTHASSGPTWKVVSTPKSIQENEIIFSANVNYAWDNTSYLARSGGQTVRIQSVTGQQSGGNGTIHLEATLSGGGHRSVEINLEFTETTYPMWLRRQAEATVARTLIELETALRNTYPPTDSQKAWETPPDWSLAFVGGDWATWQVVEVPGFTLLELAPQ
jgi:hypothetical protein